MITHRPTHAGFGALLLAAGALYACGESAAPDDALR